MVNFSKNVRECSVFFVLLFIPIFYVLFPNKLKKKRDIVITKAMLMF